MSEKSLSRHSSGKSSRRLKAEVFVQGTLEVAILSAVSLSRVSLVLKPSSFVRAFFNGTEIGKSDVVTKSTNPRFDTPIRIDILSDMQLHQCKLEFYVYHFISSTSSQLLGYVCVTGSELVHLSSVGLPYDKPEESLDDDDGDSQSIIKVENVWFDLLQKPGVSKKTSGRLELAGQYRAAPIAEAVDVHTEEDNDMSTEEESEDESEAPFIILGLRLLGARDLPNANSIGNLTRRSNPFLIVRLNGKSVYRTKPISNTLNPCFHFDVAELKFLTYDAMVAATVEIECWHTADIYNIEKTRFLGVHIIKGLEFGARLATLVDETVAEFEKRADSNAALSISRSISGDLSEGFVYPHPLTTAGFPEWFDLQPSAKRTAKENMIVQGAVGYAYNAKFTPSLRRIASSASMHRQTAIPQRNFVYDKSDAVTLCIHLLGVKEAECVVDPVKASAVELSRINSISQLYCVLRHSTGEEIGRTNIISDSHQLRWNEQRFWIRFPSYHKLTDCSLLLELYCKNLGEDSNIDSIVASIELSGRDVFRKFIPRADDHHGQDDDEDVDWMTAQEVFYTAPEWVSLSPPLSRRVPASGIIPYDQYALEIDYQMRPACAFIDDITDDDVVSVHSEAKESGKLHFRIVGGAQLKRVSNYLSTKVSKVYGLVYFNGEYIGKTPETKLTAHPKWSDAIFMVDVPYYMQITACYLNVEVYTVIVTKPTPFCPTGEQLTCLGCAEVRGFDIVRIVEKGFEVDERDRTWIQLQTSSHAPAYQIKPDVTGSICIIGQYDSAEDLASSVACSDEASIVNDREIQYIPATLHLTIREACDIGIADYSGTTDAMVVVVWNNEEIGKTAPARSTLHPVWSQQVFHLAVPRGQELRSCRLELHMYDEPSVKVGTNKFLGCVVLYGSQLQRLGEMVDDAHEQWFDLQHSKLLTAKQNMLVRGKILLETTFSLAQRILRRMSVDHERIEVFILSCDNLVYLAEKQKPNPFCVIQWNGEEVGRGPAVIRAVRPQWYTEDGPLEFKVYIPDESLIELAEGCLEIVLYHSEAGEDSSEVDTVYAPCLGRCVLPGSQLEEIRFDQKKSRTVQLCQIQLPVQPLGTRKIATPLSGDLGTLSIGLSFSTSENRVILEEEVDVIGEALNHSSVEDKQEEDKETDFYDGYVDETVMSEGTTEIDGDVLGELSPTHGKRSNMLLPHKSSYNMHLDASTGRYYYLDEANGISTWDKPLDGEISLHYHPQQMKNIIALRESIIQEKEQHLQEVRESVDRVRQYHREVKEKEAAEARAKEYKIAHAEWEKALRIASKEGGECNISWQDKQFIDPIVYDFEKTYGTSLRAVRLVGLKLKELPPEFCIQLRCLRILNLASNELTMLPETFHEMSNLTYLNVLNNKLRTLPSKIGLMCNSLCRLDIANNKLESLPSSFGALSKIQSLDFEFNQLSVMPENLEFMTGLRSLNLSNNLLQRLPRCLGRMKDLRSLSVNQNALEYICHDLCANSTLEVLRLNANKINTLPDNMGNLKTLRELWLNFNQLSYLPITFCGLTNLQILRVEGNPAWRSPDMEVVHQGAQAVVHWCRLRWNEDSEWRKKRVITAVQDMLEIATEIGDCDMSMFEAGYVIGDDAWYALQMSYFFDYILPRAEEYLKQCSVRDPVKFSRYRTKNFTYPSDQVMWALCSFADAYGVVYKEDFAYFRRCACVDKNGRRKPCVPPAKGYMCRRKCALVKSRIVLQADKEQRMWMAHKKYEIEDAVKRAEMEALKYLKSEEGSLWLTELSFERAEEIMEERGLRNAVGWREKVKEKKKQAVIRKFNKKKAKIVKARDAKASKLLLQVEDVKLSLKTSVDGYAKEQLQRQLSELYQELANLPEDETLRQMQRECDSACQRIEDDFVEDTDDSSDGEASKKETYMQRKKKELEAKKKAALANVRGALPPALLTPEKTPISDLILSTLDHLPTKQELKKHMAKLRHHAKMGMRHAFDIVQTRLMKFTLIMNGDFSEIQQEMQHAAFHQYVNNMKAVARRKAEREFYIIGKIRGQWDGLGLETCFRGWKRWVKDKGHRDRADIRNRWRSEMKQFHQDLISQHLAEAQLSLWIKHTDVYTDVPFWKNWTTNEISWVEPRLLDYVPDGFNFPKKPQPLPDNVGEYTSSEDEDEYRVKESDDESEEDETEQTAKSSSTGSPSRSRLTSKRGSVKASESLRGTLSKAAMGGGVQEEKHDDESQNVADDETSVTAETADESSLVSAVQSELTDEHFSLPQIAPRPSLSVQTDAGSVSSSATKLRNPNDFTPQKWMSLPSFSLPKITMSPPKSPIQTHFHRHLSSKNIFDRSVPLLPHYSYGPDSLRAGKLTGRVGRPVFQEEDVDVNADAYAMLRELENQSLGNTEFTETAESILNAYTYDPNADEEMAANAQKQRVDDSIYNARTKRADELARAAAAVKQRYDRGNAVRRRTYIGQRDRVPKAQEQLKEERKKKKKEKPKFERPTTPELLEMAGGGKKDTWKSNYASMNKRSILAARAVKIKEKLRKDAAKEGLIVKKQKSFVDEHITPMFLEDAPPSESDEDVVDDADDSLASVY